MHPAFPLYAHVRVIPGIRLKETNELVPDWHGEIIELPTIPADPSWMVELDAPSLQQLPETIQKHFVQPACRRSISG